MDESKLNALIAKFTMDAQSFPRRFQFKRTGFILTGWVKPDFFSSLKQGIVVAAVATVVCLFGAIVPAIGYIGLLLFFISFALMGWNTLKLIFRGEPDRFVLDLSTGNWKCNNEAYFAEIKKWAEANLKAEAKSA